MKNTIYTLIFSTTVALGLIFSSLDISVDNTQNLKEMFPKEQTSPIKDNFLISPTMVKNFIQVTGIKLTDSNFQIHDSDGKFYILVQYDNIIDTADLPPGNYSLFIKNKRKPFTKT